MTHWKQRSTTNLDVVYFDYQLKAQYDSADVVYVWDLDKTYLDTSIDSLSGLFYTIFERPLQKRTCPALPI